MFTLSTTSQGFRSRAGDTFWERSGGAATAFLNFANFDDWIVTLKSLSRVIADRCALTSQRPLDAAPTMMDFGCGFAHSLRDIINILSSEHNFPTRWYAYDPDREIIDLLSKKTWSSLTNQRNFPGIVSYTDNLSEIELREKNRLAAVTFMHSIYYVDNVPDCIAYCFEKLLHDGGHVILLKLSEHSPFYVLDEFLPQNGLDQLAKTFTIVEKIPRAMRFSIPQNLLYNELFTMEMFRLMSRGREGLSGRLDEFRAAFTAAFSGIVDLRDEIIVVRP